jgi:uncharacterized protein YrrD
MENMLQFQQNASVLAADGRAVGRLDRVVLNPETKVLSHIVVRSGSLFSKKEEKVVPVEEIAEATREQIVLRTSDLDSLPALQEERAVAFSEDQPPAGSSAQPLLYGSPMTGTPAPAQHPFITRFEQNIPEGTVAMKEGARVISVEGKRVGSVERVLARAPEDRATHLLVSSGLFVREKKMIPIAWVLMLGEAEVHLRVKKDSVEKLEPA